MENQKPTEFTKKLLALAVPAAFQQFMLALVSASDAFMLGALAQDALSAVSLAGQIAFVENLFLAAMTIGLSMFAAQYIGKEDYDSTEHIFAYVMKITVLISAVFFLAGLCMPKLLMHIFTNEQILIFGLFGFPQMGIAGAALATVVARLIETTWSLFEIEKKGTIRLRFCNI